MHTHFLIVKKIIEFSYFLVLFHMFKYYFSEFSSIRRVLILKCVILQLKFTEDSKVKHEKRSLIRYPD